MVGLVKAETEVLTNSGPEFSGYAGDTEWWKTWTLVQFVDIKG